jgi:hypothetical protein
METVHAIESEVAEALLHNGLSYEDVEIRPRRMTPIGIRMFNLSIYGGPLVDIVPETGPFAMDRVLANGTLAREMGTPYIVIMVPNLEEKDREEEGRPFVSQRANVRKALEFMLTRGLVEKILDGSEDPQNLALSLIQR